MTLKINPDLSEWFLEQLKEISGLLMQILKLLKKMMMEKFMNKKKKLVEIQIKKPFSFVFIKEET